MRGQVPHVPGTTRNGRRTKSAINNSQASGYVRVPEGVAQCLGLPRHRSEAPRYQTEAPRYRSTAPVAGATKYKHICDTSKWLERTRRAPIAQIVFNILVDPKGPVGPAGHGLAGTELQDQVFKFHQC